MADDQRRLQDIVDAADEAAKFLKGVTQAQFTKDRLRQRAIERVLTILGEAAKQLDDTTRAAIDQPWREIIRFRDKGVHAYDSLSPGMLYRIATESVPKLREAVASYQARRQG